MSQRRNDLPPVGHPVPPPDDQRCTYQPKTLRCVRLAGHEHGHVLDGLNQPDRIDVDAGDW